MHKFCSLFMLIGRVMLALVFVFAGLSKLMDPDATIAYMESSGIENISLLMYSAAVIELLGGLLLIFGYKTRVGASLLMVFLVGVTCMMHNFWAFEGAAQKEEMIHFFMNVSIFGGLLYVLCFGSGKYGFDASCCPAKQEQ